MGMGELILGLIVFIGTHLVTTQRGFRASLIEKHGATVYKIAYSLLSFAGLALIVHGFGAYRATGWIDVWMPPTGMRHLAAALMLPAAILLVAAYLRGNIYKKVKHPMLAAVKLWATAHLLSNGDLGSIILFGSFLAWAVFSRISIKRRADAGGPAIPVGGWLNDLLAVVVGIIVYLAIGFAIHPIVIGVPVFGV